VDIKLTQEGRVELNQDEHERGEFDQPQFIKETPSNYTQREFIVSEKPSCHGDGESVPVASAGEEKAGDVAVETGGDLVRDVLSVLEQSSEFIFRFLLRWS